MHPNSCYHRSNVCIWTPRSTLVVQATQWLLAWLLRSQRNTWQKSRSRTKKVLPSRSISPNYTSKCWLQRKSLTRALNSCRVKASDRLTFGLNKGLGNWEYSSKADRQKKSSKNWLRWLDTITHKSKKISKVSTIYMSFCSAWQHRSVLRKVEVKLI